MSQSIKNNFNKGLLLLLSSFCAYSSDSLFSNTEIPKHIPLTTWSGLYVGSESGSSAKLNMWRLPFDQVYTRIDAKRSFSTRPQGSIPGAHLGFNYQLRSFIVGAESSFNDSAIGQRHIGSQPTLVGLPAEQYQAKISNFNTVAGRLGYTYNNKWMLYAKGGFASAYTDAGVNGLPKETLTGMHLSAPERRTGWTVGSGLEYNVIPSLILGLQYDFIHLGNQNMSNGQPTNMKHRPLLLSFQDITLNTISARVSLKIDGLLNKMSEG